MKIKIFVISHDAGGANILNALAKKYISDFDWRICAKGPASKIFGETINTAKYSRKNLDITRIIEKEKPDLILTGTSWSSGIETDFIRCGKSNGIKTAAFLDHWANYRERFGFPGGWKQNLPDFVFVGDRWAYRLAVRDGFPGNELILTENPYFEEMFEEWKSMRQASMSTGRHNGRLRILYLSEPVYDHALKHYGDPYYWGYTEYEIVNDLLKAGRECPDLRIRLRVRLHPSEKIGKYKGSLRNKAAAVVVSKDRRLMKDCLWADIVIGSDTTALAAASMAGRKAISYIPGIKKKVFPAS